MKIILTILLTIIMTGCASNCTDHCYAGFGPGNSVFNAMASHYDKMDDCQFYGKPEGYKLPGFCFANAGKRVYYVRDVNNRLIATLR